MLSNTTRRKKSQIKVQGRTKGICAKHISQVLDSFLPAKFRLEIKPIAIVPYTGLKENIKLSISTTQSFFWVDVLATAAESTQRTHALIPILGSQFVPFL